MITAAPVTGFFKPWFPGPHAGRKHALPSGRRLLVRFPQRMTAVEPDFDGGQEICESSGISMCKPLSFEGTPMSLKWQVENIKCKRRHISLFAIRLPGPRRLQLAFQVSWMARSYFPLLWQVIADNLVRLDNGSTQTPCPDNMVHYSCRIPHK